MSFKAVDKRAGSASPTSSRSGGVVDHHAPGVTDEPIPNIHARERTAADAGLIKVQPLKKEEMQVSAYLVYRAKFSPLPLLTRFSHPRSNLMHRISVLTRSSMVSTAVSPHSNQTLPSGRRDLLFYPVSSAQP